MKPHARIILAVCFAVLSTTTIVTCVTTRPDGHGPEEMTKLKKFETRFNHTINEAIRSPDATTFAAQTCFTSFIDQRIQNVADAGAAVCDLSTANKQELRDAVNRWLDGVYARDGGLDPLGDASIDTAWFSMKVDSASPDAGVAGGGN
jgi:hypothetical protein